MNEQVLLACNPIQTSLSQARKDFQPTAYMKHSERGSLIQNGTTTHFSMYYCVWSLSDCCLAHENHTLHKHYCTSIIMLTMHNLNTKETLTNARKDRNTYYTQCTINSLYDLGLHNSCISTKEPLRMRTGNSFSC